LSIQHKNLKKITLRILLIGKGRKALKKNQPTLTAVVTTSPTTPGAALHVPNPTEGILAPFFSSKL
jgi:hypothetical protein